MSLKIYTPQEIEQARHNLGRANSLFQEAENLKLQAYYAESEAKLIRRERPAKLLIDESRLEYEAKSDYQPKRAELTRAKLEVVRGNYSTADAILEQLLSDAERSCNEHIKEPKSEEFYRAYRDLASLYTSAGEILMRSVREKIYDIRLEQVEGADRKEINERILALDTKLEEAKIEALKEEGIERILAFYDRVRAQAERVGEVTHASEAVEADVIRLKAVDDATRLTGWYRELKWFRDLCEKYIKYATESKPANDMILESFYYGIGDIKEFGYNRVTMRSCGQDLIGLVFQDRPPLLIDYESKDRVRELLKKVLDHWAAVWIKPPGIRYFAFLD